MPTFAIMYGNGTGTGIDCFHFIHNVVRRGVEH